MWVLLNFETWFSLHSNMFIVVLPYVKCTWFRNAIFTTLLFFQSYSDKAMPTKYIPTKVLRQSYSDKCIPTELFRHMYSDKAIPTKVFRHKYSDNRYSDTGIPTKVFRQSYADKLYSDNSTPTKLFRQIYSDKGIPTTSIQTKVFRQSYSYETIPTTYYSNHSCATFLFGEAFRSTICLEYFRRSPVLQLQN